MATDLNARNQRPDVSRVLAAVAALALLWSAFGTVRVGLTELIGDEVAADLVAWQQQRDTTGLPPTEAEWKESRSDLSRAISRDGNNPRYHELDAALSRQLYRTASGVASHEGESVTALETAVRLRPTSPFSWAMLAEAKYRAGKVDPAFHAALENAVEMGPGERDVLLTVADLGLAVFDQAPASTRKRIQEALQNADRRESIDLVAIAARRGKLEQVCGLPKAAKAPVCIDFLKTT